MVTMNEEKLIYFIKKELSESEMNRVQQWINSSDENERYFQRIKLLWENAAYENQEIIVNKREAWEKIHSSISGKNVKRTWITGHPQYVFRRIAAAAILIISIGIIALVLRFQDRDETINWVSEITTIEKKEIILPDDSHVWLDRNTTLTYPEKFTGETRSVILSGEAFFEVFKQKRKPFLISAKNSGIQVLGTSFNVKSEAFSSQVVVSVVSGKVAFFDSTRVDNRIILETGDQGIYDINDRTLTRKRNAERNFLAWKTGILVFVNSPIEMVCRDLSEHFDLPVELIPNPEIAEKRLTATFDNKELEDILKILELTLDIQYTSEQDRIVLFIE